MQQQQDWRKALPSVSKLKQPNDLVVAHFQDVSKTVHFYVIQGEPRGFYPQNYFLFGGYAVTPTMRFPIALDVSQHDLEKGVWLGNKPVQLDSEFNARCWVDIYKELFPPTPTTTSISGLSVGKALRMQRRGRL